MKRRLLPYLVLLPIILLIAYTDIDVYLKYMAIASIPLSIGLIVYMFIKSSAYYKAKKVLLFIIFALTLFAPLVPAYAQTTRSQNQTTYQSKVSGKDAKKLEQYWELKKTLNEIGRIPKEQRTKQEQKKYEDAKKDFAKLNKDLNIKPSCATTQELQEEIANNCWACDIANLFIEGADKVAINFYKFDQDNGVSKSLLVLGLFGWILMHVLKLLMTFGRGDIGAFFTDLFLKLLLVGGIFILLSFPIQGIVNFAITPVFTLSATLGQQIGKAADLEKIPDTISAASDVSREDAVQIKNNIQKMFNQSERCKYCVAFEKGDESQEKIISKAMGHTALPEERVISATMRNSLLCTICSVYKVTVEPTVVGQYLLCNSKNRTSKIKDFVSKAFYTDWDSLSAGLFIIIAFFSIAGLFSFYLVDTFFRIAIVLILLPLLIVAAAFKSTLSYTKKGFEIIIHSFFTYIILAIFMTLTVQLYYHFLGGEAMELIKLAFTNDYDKLREAISFRSSGRIVACSVGLALFVYMMLKHIDEYITAISGISLNNSTGMRTFDQAKATVGSVVAFVPRVFNKKWEGGVAGKNNSAQEKANKIRKWGKQRTWLEKKIDKSINAKTTQKIEQANKLIEEGHKFRGRIAKMKAKTSAFLAKRASHTIIRTAMFIPKALARNKYFNKTVGLLWQIGKDVGLEAAAKKGYKHAAPKVAAKLKYLKDKFGKKEQ